MTDDLSPADATLATMWRHTALLQEAMLSIRHALERRAQRHDLSKLVPGGELPGFVRINATARRFPYGSDEYKASLEAERPTIDAHYAANSHHPEFWADLSDMGWLDMVEMVCDWWAASRTYGKTSFDASVELSLKRWPWSPEQAWFIKQVASGLAD